MRLSHPILRLLAIALFAPRLVAVDSTVSSVDRPFDLSVVGAVQVAGGDAASASFQANSLPAIQAYLNLRLGETSTLDPTLFAVDPARLLLAFTSAVRVYFVGEGAGYHNSFGFSSAGAVPSLAGSTDSKLIFPDASSPTDYMGGSGTTRTESTPLLSGDYVDLGTFTGGTSLDFFLIANGAGGGRNTYWTDPSANPDGIPHVVSFVSYIDPASNLLILGFEDLYGGGDRDYNDLVVAIDIGAANIRALIAGPEPSQLLLAAVLLVGLMAIRRRQSGQAGVA